MRWYVWAICAGAALVAFGCDALPATPQSVGQLAFQKDSTCADTANTELYVDTISRGQYTMGPGSIEGFNVSGGNTHFAKAIERSGRLRQFSVQAIYVPPLGVGTYLMQCAHNDSIPLGPPLNPPRR